MARRLAGADPVVFDIGANVGQTALRVGAWPGAQVYSFEPSPSSYRNLVAATAHLPNVRCFNAGMGERVDTLSLLENSSSDLTSFLRPSEAAWGEIVRETPVDIWTVDGFCKEHQISHVSLVKTDAQGFDLAVLRGAELTLTSVDVVMTEITFAQMYEDAPRFDELLTFVLDHGFRLVGMFPVHQERIAKWADVIFTCGRMDEAYARGHAP